MAIATSAARRTLVLFEVGASTLALPVEQARETLRRPPITRVPKAVDYVVGVVNVRGMITPLIDLSILLELDGGAQRPASILTLEIPDESRKAPLFAAVLVDRVHSVQESELVEVVDPPSTLAKVADDLIVVLDLRRILGAGPLSFARFRSDTPRGRIFDGC